MVLSRLLEKNPLLLRLVADKKKALPPPFLSERPCFFLIKKI